MNIGFAVSRAGPSVMKLVPSYENMHLEAWALMYPDDATYMGNPKSIEKLLRQGEIDLVVGTLYTDSDFHKEISALARVCKELGVPVFCTETDYFNTWMCSTSGIFKTVCEVFDAVDTVLVRHPHLLAVVKGLTDTPAVLWFDPSGPCTANAEYTKEVERNIIALPSAFRDNTLKNVVTNYLVAKQLQIEFPEYDFRVLSGNYVKSTAEEVVNIDGFAFKTGPVTHNEILDTLWRTKVFINLDYQYVGGVWVIDAASTGTPTIATRFTTAGCFLNTSVSHPYAINEALIICRGLLKDQDYWNDQSKKIKRLSLVWSAPVARKRLEKLINMVQTKKEQ